MTIPQEVKNILTKLQEAGFEAYAVGGCVRDLILNKIPKDWDICTNALPEQIQEIFPDSFYENKFGTVTVKQLSAEEYLEQIEVTTYRVDDVYTDKRHPDAVRFTPNLQEDLARRDFTINAMALDLAGKITDPFGGQEDLAKGIIRAVGEPEKRFNEDALRMLRAVRFSVELVPRDSVKQGFSIEDKTKKAIKNNAAWLQAIAKERIRDEFVKIMMSERASDGILLLHELGLLEFVIPELEKGFGVAQNKHHIYTIFEHGVFSLKFAAQKKFNLIVRLAALLHDVAKPQAKRGEGESATFYNHDIMGARAAVRILERLRFDNETIEKVAHLIRHHMFVYDVGAVTEAGVRRLLARVGPANMEDLISLRVADRLGSGVPKAQPYRLRHFQYMVDKVQHDPISAKMLKVNGHNLMDELKIKPGPKIGAILDVLLAEVIEEPQKNDKDILLARAKELDKVDLTQLRQMAKTRIEEEKEEEDKVIKGRYWV
ncbi:MAG: HD domain-containing protein [Candidatus Portnoybacteria bacterium]|nr:HD domain-containing protein [Candidatus Portnoybacteria bacterium]MDD4982774.1 HD domain-containing protein [Candidatus Portnoybacteria bacterium]